MEASTRTEGSRSMVIVDSSVLIDYLANRSTPQTQWLEQHFSQRRIGITTLILTEVLQGIRDEKLFTETHEALKRFAVFEVASLDLAVRSARNYRKMRQRGITVRNTIDCLTATFCINEGYELLHNDRDFDPFEDLLQLRVVSLKTAN